MAETGTIVLGIDFDNTIVSYDDLFHKVCLEKGCIPPDLPMEKNAVRDYLRQKDQEELWTEIQGYVYGKRMSEAKPYPGVKEFFTVLQSKHIKTYIISHKTQYPYLGDKVDLHQAAGRWIEEQGFYSHDLGMSPDRVFFNLTKKDKIACIRKQACTHFIDDLPEILQDPDFPKELTVWLFDPRQAYADSSLDRFSTWPELTRIIQELVG